MATGELRWRASQRLAGAAVQQVLKEGRARTVGTLRLQYRANGLEHVRLAQVIPKKLAARAVDRNRIRRVVREAFRLEQQRWAGYDCVVRLRSPWRKEDDHREAALRLVAGGP